MAPPTEPCALRSTQPLKFSTRDFSWGKGGRCVWLTTYQLCSAETSRKSVTLTYPEPLGHLGLSRHTFTLLYFTLLYFTLLYFTLLHFTLLYFTLLYFTLLYFTLLYFTLLHFTSLHFTSLHFTLLYFTSLHFTYFIHLFLHVFHFTH